jgi:tRNA (guanine-N7-)-methyltransferase
VPRLRHHVNPLHASYLATGAQRLLLPDGGEVEVELGCADALFLFQRAAARPDLCCIGVELRRDLVVDVNRRAQAAGLSRLQAVFANGQTEFDALFPEGRLARVFINFPDPWFKRRHQKRRVVGPALVRAIDRTLAAGGELFFQSDVFELALDAMATIEESGRFANLHGEWSFAPANPFGARSLREVRCLERELAIWRLHYRRTGPTPTPRLHAGGDAG